jgi:hypothetical protein
MKQKGHGQLKVTHGAGTSKAWVGPPQTHFTSPIVTHRCISSHPDSTSSFILLGLRSLFSCPSLSYYSHSLQLSPFTPLDTVDALIPERQHNPLSVAGPHIAQSDCCNKRPSTTSSLFFYCEPTPSKFSFSKSIIATTCKAGLTSSTCSSFLDSNTPADKLSGVGIIFCTSHYFNSIQPSTII